MTNWKRTLLATASGIVLAGSAQAADLPLKAAPMALPITNWTGFYIGGHIGAGTSLDTCGLAAGGNSYACSDYGRNLTARDTGFVGGVNAGYDWQDRSFVYGVAADWTWTSIHSKIVDVSGSSGYQSKVNWLASFRGRAGLAVENTLVYATGGLALGNFKECIACGGTGTDWAHSSTNTWVGWVAGVGVEHKFNRNWSVDFKYLHYAFGSRDIDTTYSTTTYHHRFSHSVDVATIGLNYRW